jgi:hypothetical protein
MTLKYTSMKFFEIFFAETYKIEKMTKIRLGTAERDTSQNV